MLDRTKSLHGWCEVNTRVSLQGSEVTHLAEQDSTDMMKALDRIQQQETVRD